MVAVMALAMAGTSVAGAEDLGALELGKTYEFPNYKETTATFTAPANGKVLMEGETFEVYTDADRKNSVDKEHIGYALGGQSYLFEVTEASTYYFYCKFPMNGKLRLTMEQELELMSISPESGSTFSHAGSGSCIITFNAPISVEKGVLSTNGVNVNVTPSTYNSTIQIDLTSRIETWLRNGVLQKGQEFTLTLTGIKTITDGKLYNGDGKLTVTYVSAGQPAKLVNAKTPAVFKSYWMPGDADGIVTLTFDRDLKPEGAVATLHTGNVEGATGEYYIETLPVTINGATATVDFTGKSRRTSEMLTTNETPADMSFQISQLRDIDGNYVTATQAGMIGSFAYTIPYLQLEKVEVIGSFTPANGESLEGVDNLSLQITGLSAIRFDGFKFEYADGNEMKSTVVPVESCQLEDIGQNWSEYTIPIPTEVKGKKNITVTLANLVSTDGIDHSKDVKAQYDAFVITFCYPADGTEFESLTEGTEISVEVNYADLYPEMYLEYEIIDLNPVNPNDAVLKSYSWLTRNEYGGYDATVYGSYKMIRGHEYSVVFTAWESEAEKHSGAAPVGTATISWYGLSEPFVASEYKFESINPALGTVLEPTDTEFTLVFDGMVSIANNDAKILLGSGESMAFEAVTPLEEPVYDEETGLAFTSQWKLTVPAEYMSTLSAALMFSVKAYDMDFHLLVDENEEYPTETSFLLFEYETANTSKEFNVTPANGTTVKSLEAIVVSEEVGIMPSYNVPVGEIVVKNFDGDVVANVTDVVLPEPDPENPFADITTLTLPLSKAVTANGEYVIYFPSAVFYLGKEQEQWISAETFVYFTIDSEGGIENVVASENGVLNVFNLQGIHVGTFESADGLKSLPVGIYIVNGTKIALK